MTDSPPDTENNPVSEVSPTRDLANLASDLTKMAKQNPENFARRVASLNLREQAELALRLPADQRLEMLLHAPKPMRLVRSLPDSELYLTVREVGPIDSVPLLALASAQQIGHLIDLESWRGDRFDAARTGAWVALLVSAGDSTLKRFLNNTDDEILALMFKQWMRIEQLEYEDGADKHGHGLGDAGTESGFLTPDGYHQSNPVMEDHTPAIRRILKMLFEDQADRYQEIIWASIWDLPSNLEEQALHWRQSRLEEHGFPNFEEALSVFEPAASRSSELVDPAPVNPDAVSAGRMPLRTQSRRGTLPLAIDQLQDRPRERVLGELVNIANRLLVAEHADSGDPEAHRRATQKAAIYVELGLELSGVVEPAAMAERLGKRPVFEWFSDGYARPAELQRIARRLVIDGWASSHPDALDLLDSPVRERLLALIEPRPLYFSPEDDDGTGKGGQRDFMSLAEIEESRVALEVAALVGRILVDSMGFDVASFMGHQRDAVAMPPRFSTLLLTAMAWVTTRSELRGEPLAPEHAAEFVRLVASRRTAAPESAERAFADLVLRLTELAKLTPRETTVLEAFGRYCLRQLSDECSNLDPEIPLDPRTISCLLLNPSTP